MCPFNHDPALGWKTKDVRHGDTANVHNDPNSRVLIDLKQGLVDVIVDQSPPFHLDKYVICHGQVGVTGQDGSEVYYKEIL